MEIEFDEIVRRLRILYDAGWRVTGWQGSAPPTVPPQPQKQKTHITWQRPQ